MKVVSPSAISLPPYIVFCPVNANVFARGSPIAALMTNAMLPLCAINCAAAARVYAKFMRVDRH
jgi:hypothetical protein